MDVLDAEMYLSIMNDNIINLYTVGEKGKSGTSVPYIHIASLHGPWGTGRCVSRRLVVLLPSQKVLCVANGAIMLSQGIWKGVTEFGGVR